MKCQFCGANNPDGVSRCQVCGGNLSPEPTLTDAVPFGPSTQPFDQPGSALRMELVTTGLGFEGFRIVRHMGVVRGLTVRSRSIVGNIIGQTQAIFGGNISAYVDLCETAREEAYNLLVEHARQLGANAVIGMRYDANDVMDGITEVLAYGTAVIIEPQASTT